MVLSQEVVGGTWGVLIVLEGLCHEEYDFGRPSFQAAQGPDQPVVDWLQQTGGGLACLVAERMTCENYSSVVSFLRRRFSFDLLKTCVIAMRGYKKPTTLHAAKIDNPDLRTTASSC